MGSTSEGDDHHDLWRRAATRPSEPEDRTRTHSALSHGTRTKREGALSLDLLEESRLQIVNSFGSHLKPVAFRELKQRIRKAIEEGKPSLLFSCGVDDKGRKAQAHIMAVFSEEHYRENGILVSRETRTFQRGSAEERRFRYWVQFTLKEKEINDHERIR